MASFTFSGERLERKVMEVTVEAENQEAAIEAAMQLLKEANDYDYVKHGIHHRASLKEVSHEGEN